MVAPDNDIVDVVSSGLTKVAVNVPELILPSSGSVSTAQVALIFAYVASSPSDICPFALTRIAEVEVITGFT